MSDAATVVACCIVQYDRAHRSADTIIARSDGEKAVWVLEEVVTVSESIGSAESNDWALDQLGRAYAKARRPQDALAAHEAELQFARQRGNRIAEGHASCNIAAAYTGMHR